MEMRVRFNYSGLSDEELDIKMCALREEYNKEHKTEILRNSIIDTCSSIHKHLVKAVGATQVAKRSGRYVALILTTTPATKVFAAVAKDPGASAKIRAAFEQLMDVATAIAEPILWFYALTSLIIMATGKSRTLGWTRLKAVGYSYIGITMLPTIFAFLRWIGNVLKVAFQTF